MLLEKEFIDFFGNLPRLSKMEIVKHFNQCDLLVILTISDKWDQLINISDPDNTVSIEELLMNMSELEKIVSIDLINDINSTKLKVKKDLKDALFWESRDLSIDFSIDSTKNGVWEMRNDNEILCFSRNFDELQKSIFNFYQKISRYFHVRIGTIQVNFDSGFTLKYLKSFNFAWIGGLSLIGENFDENELNDYLKNQKIRTAIDFNLEKMENLKLGSHCSVMMRFVLSNSKFITPKQFLNSIDAHDLILKNCNFSSKILNQYFKLWKKLKKSHVSTAEFYMENEVNVGELLEGLDTKQWDPEERDRYFIIERETSQSAVDLSEGYDFESDTSIYERESRLGSILVSEDKKKVSFFRWSRVFTIQCKKMICERSIQVHDYKLNDGTLSRVATRAVQKKREIFLRRLEFLMELIN